MTRAVLGIDLGTGSVKAAIVESESGAILGLGSAEHPTTFPEPGAAEQSPEAWWRATIAAVSQARVSAGGEVTIERIGITGQMHGTVLLESDRAVVSDAIIWSDTRSAEAAQSLMAEAGTDVLSIAGSPVAAGFQAATIRWLRHTRPDLWKQTRHVLLPKDYLRLRLTGELATDPSDAAGTLLSDRLTRDWSAALLDLAGVPREYLPEIRPSSRIAGVLTGTAADALGLSTGIPVVTGVADAAAAALGAGVIDEHQLLITLSTGAQVLVPRMKPDFDDRGRLHTFASASEPSSNTTGWYIMGATTVAGLALRWLRDNVLAEERAHAYDRLMELACRVPVGANRLLFLPHMTGERSPDLNPHARGAFIGLTPAHERADLVRAVLEGVVLSIYDAYRAVTEVVTQPAQEIILAGGGARSPLWRSMIADLFNLPVRPLETAEQTVMGSAILAASESADPAAVARSWARYGDQVHPNPERHYAYRELFDIYAHANRALSETYAELAGFPASTHGVGSTALK
jgi:xylulokinase